MPQHHLITNPARIHEAKQIAAASTGDAGKIITPSSTTPGQGELRNLAVSELDYSGRTPWTGWAFYADDEYTTGARRTILDGVRTKLTINGSGTQTNETQLPVGGTSLWSSVTNKITPMAENDAYDIRVQFKCATSAASPFVDLDLDVGGSLGVITKESRTVQRGGGLTNHITFSWPIFCASTFLANGGELYLTPDGDTDFWDFSILIVRTHKGA